MPSKKNQRLTTRRVNIPRGIALGECVLHLRDILGTALTATSAIGADTITSIQVGVSTAGFSPLMNAFATTFLKYKIVKCTINFAPLTPTSQFGQLAVGFYDDPDVALTTFVEVFQSSASKTASIYQRIMFTLPPMTDWLFCEAASDKRFYNYGLLAVAATGTSTAVNPSLPLMDFTIAYKGQFQV